MSLNIFGGQGEGFFSEEREGLRGESAPNNTIYISNLNEKVPIDDLKDTLFSIFEEYGEIIDVSTSTIRSSPKKTSGCEDRPSSSSETSIQPWKPSAVIMDVSYMARQW